MKMNNILFISVLKELTAEEQTASKTSLKSHVRNAAFGLKL